MFRHELLLCIGFSLCETVCPFGVTVMALDEVEGSVIQSVYTHGLTSYFRTNQLLFPVLAVVVGPLYWIA